MTDQPLILGISGSLRAGSFSTAILRSVGGLLEGKARFAMLAMEDLPLYNQDLDTAAPPEPVARLRQQIADAEGLVIATPEYNYGMPGVLKNVLDWASRPFGQSRLTGKPVLTLSSSPAFTGGVRAQAQLNETLLANSARIVLRPQIVIGLVMEKVRDGEMVDEQSLRFLEDGLGDLLGVVRGSSATVAQEA